jgi:crossover junction endodeoxyribonuclease RuvC
VVERIFVAASPRAALVLGQARGVALATVGALGIEVREYAPGEIKLSVAGTGAAEKRQVQAMVRRLLALDADPAADAADALAAAICHGHRGPLAALGATRRRGPGLRRAAGRASSVVVRRS